MKALRAALLGLLIVAGGPTGYFLWATAVPGESFAGPLPAMTEKELDLSKVLRRDIEEIATTPHNLSHAPALESAAQMIERELGNAGYAVEKQYLDGEAQLTRNIEVVVAPASAGAETLVVGAHYDSAMNTPGANDNGSGTAALLALSRELAALSGKSKVRLRLVFFVNEEPPYFKTNRMGSLVYAEALSRKRETVAGMISLETMGYYRDAPGSQNYPFPLSLRYPDTGNFIAFVATNSSRDFLRRTVADFRTVARFPSVGGSAPAIVQGIDWSDHWSFEQYGMNGLMVTDTAPFRYPYYHKPDDTPDKLDYDRLARVTAALGQMLHDYAVKGLPDGE